MAHIGTPKEHIAAQVYWTLCGQRSRAVMDHASAALKAAGHDVEPDFRNVPTDMHAIVGRIAAHGIALSRGCGDRVMHLRMILALASSAHSISIVAAETV